MLDSRVLFGVEGNQNAERRRLSPSFWIDSRDQSSNLKKNLWSSFISRYTIISAVIFNGLDELKAAGGFLYVADALYP